MLNSNKISKLALAVACIFVSAPAVVSAAGGSSGPHVNYAVQGHIGEVIVNPYNVAPLTAVVRNGGYQLKDVSVKVLPKLGGREISYSVSQRQLLTHAGIPIWGLYPDHNNTVEVSYTRVFHGKEEKFTDTYRFYCAPVWTASNGMPTQKGTMFDVKVKKVDPEFADRLYLVNNNLLPIAPQGARFVWNNPTGGALEWGFTSQTAIIDTTGAVRWYLMSDWISKPDDPWSSGVMLGFQQTNDGALTWGYGQRYAKYDFMGREIYNRRFPVGYGDFSHAMDNAQNGNLLVRVSSTDYRRPDNKRVHTVRDVVIEMDQNGTVVDEWRFMDILDPYRDDVLQALDQGAVCLNVDASKAGQTMSKDELAKQDSLDVWGDIPGVGAGRNWAHINSVDYDPTDDSIIISSRHQSAAIKVGRDKQVKWILSSPEGWGEKFKDKLLTPVDKDGKPLKCTGSTCEGGFDWSWTQHSTWRIDELSNDNIIYLTSFDNGDARGMQQPALPEMKYSRAVIYKIDQKKMTVQQVWSAGEQHGYDYYCPSTGNTLYMADKNSVVVYYGTAGLGQRPVAGGARAGSGRLHPQLEEYKWGATTPSVEMTLNDTFGYQVIPVDVKKAFK